MASLSEDTSRIIILSVKEESDTGYRVIPFFYNGSWKLQFFTANTSGDISAAPANTNVSGKYYYIDANNIS